MNSNTKNYCGILLLENCYLRKYRFEHDLTSLTETTYIRFYETSIDD